MKAASLLLSLMVLIGIVGLGSVSGETRVPVVVELFTSEGCSSCPPADTILGKLRQLRAPNGAEVLVLGEHVDYRNHSGWTDRFSPPTLTERQNGYARRFHLGSAYTPQMVIDGRFETVGSDSNSVQREIVRAAQVPEPPLLEGTVKEPDSEISHLFHRPAQFDGHLFKSHVFREAVQVTLLISCRLGIYPYFFT